MTQTNKKTYIPPIIEYEELDNECPFLTISYDKGWAIDGNPPNEVEQQNPEEYKEGDFIWEID